MTRRLSRLLPLLGVVLLLTLGSATVSAAVTTENETVYNGGQADADQAIEVTYTVSPDGGTINNMTVKFDSTARSFIQGDSFSVTVNPGEANIDVQSRPGNRFFIREIQPDEQVTFVFEAYPTTIKQKQLDVVAVRMNYIQNGQELSDSETVTANMSSSPWFELQAAQERIDRLESRLKRTSLVGQFTNAAFLGGIFVGIVGLAFGGFAWWRHSSEEERLKRDHARDLERLAGRMESRDDEKKLNNEAEKVRDEIDGNGDTNDSW